MPSLGNPPHWLHYVGQLLHTYENDMAYFVLANCKFNPTHRPSVMCHNMFKQCQATADRLPQMGLKERSHKFALRPHLIKQYDWLSSELGQEGNSETSGVDSQGTIQ